jgi:hypothetical protein
VNVEEIKSVLKEQREDAENLMSRAIPRDVPKEELLTNLSIPNVLAILGVRRSGKSYSITPIIKGQKLCLCRF